MKIVVLGAGRMGAWLCEALRFSHELAVYDTNPLRMRYLFEVVRLSDLYEIKAFEPELLINAVSLQHTFSAFGQAIPMLGPNCMLADLASVKNGLEEYYTHSGRPFVSVHPMFGPTFANLSDLSQQHAIIISQSCDDGKAFFRRFFNSLGLQIHEMTFEEHDRTMALSLTLPFATTLLFAAAVQPHKTPGTTFARHMSTAHGLLSEDEHLLAEVLFNPHGLTVLDNMTGTLEHLRQLVSERNLPAMKSFLKSVRDNIHA